MTEADLKMLVEGFYARARKDALLGPLFEAAVGDWPEHLARLSSFWSSVMLTTGSYKGSPMSAHLRHAEAISPEMFERWLDLWRETAREILSAADADAVIGKAERIAESLQLALFFRLPPVRAEGPRPFTHMGFDKGEKEHAPRDCRSLSALR